MKYFFLVLEATSENNGPFNPDDFLNKLFPNFWDFVVQFLAFLVLIFLVVKFGYKPIKKLLDARKAYVDENLNGSLKAKQEAESYINEAKNNVLESKKTATSIIEEAKAEATKEREKILNLTKEDVKKEKQKADEEIMQAKKAAKESIQKEIVDVAMQASSQLLEREVNSEDNKKFIEGFVSSISKEEE